MPCIIQEDQAIEIVVTSVAGRWATNHVQSVVGGARITRLVSPHFLHQRTDTDRHGNYLYIVMNSARYLCFSSQTRMRC